MQKCACKYKSNFQTISINFPAFVHDKYATRQNGLKIKKCKNCGIIISEQAEKYQSHFNSIGYINSSQTTHSVYSKQKKKLVNRNIIQLEILKSKFIDVAKPKILDIGCNDFNLLKELHKDYKNGIFFGYDIDRKFKRFCPNKKNFYFISKDLKKIKIKFDIIIFSQSIDYIKNIKILLKTLNTILSDNGKLFISTDDYKFSPVSLLHLDRYNHFTERSLKNILNSSGYFATRIFSKDLNAELLIKAIKTKKKEKNYFLEDNSLKLIMKSLEKIKTKIHQIKQNVIYTFGISSKAALVDELLNKKTFQFVREGKLLTVKKFRGKKIIHPKFLPKKAEVIVLTNKKVNSLVRRLNRTYKASFIPINF